MLAKGHKQSCDSTSYCV